MKRRLTALLCVMLMILGRAWAEREPAYEARAWRDFHIRQEPESTYRVAEVKTDAKVTVYEYGDEWCYIHYRNYWGWCRTDWLWGFHSLDAARYPTPGHRAAVGAVILTEETWIQGGEFAGVAVKPGAFVCVSGIELEYILPVWRDEGSFPVYDGDFCPFLPWEEAQPGDMIAGFTTFYNEKTGGSLAENRAFNIQMACGRVQGMVLEPGASFSFNAVCGPYTQKMGYRMAPNISNDGKGYGGGVCQVTTTLYNAVLSLPLQVDAWGAHRRQGVDYIPISLDAAVGSYQDFAFTNTLPYPILLWAEAQDGALTVLIYRMLEQ